MMRINIYLTISIPARKIIIATSSSIKITSYIVVFIITPIINWPLRRSTSRKSCCRNLNCCWCCWTDGSLQTFTNLFEIHMLIKCYSCVTSMIFFIQSTAFLSKCLRKKASDTYFSFWNYVSLKEFEALKQTVKSSIITLCMTFKIILKSSK